MHQESNDFLCNICSIYIDLLNKVRLNHLEHSGYHAQDYLFCAVANSTAQQGLAYHCGYSSGSGIIDEVVCHKVINPFVLKQ